ncbi:hypothetical protein [Burkholderia territorii]|uniref:hypothetical protein n=1 Tax=Burkholderia territorii TaxID=1503055 RepID=UPI0012DA6534|nr:hypothetical protein [Burkholderia territorii]
MQFAGKPLDAWFQESVHIGFQPEIDALIRDLPQARRHCLQPHSQCVAIERGMRVPRLRLARPPARTPCGSKSIRKAGQWGVTNGSRSTGKPHAIACALRAN